MNEVSQLASAMLAIAFAAVMLVAGQLYIQSRPERLTVIPSALTASVQVGQAPQSFPDRWGTLLGDRPLWIMSTGLLGTVRTFRGHFQRESQLMRHYRGSTVWPAEFVRDCRQSLLLRKIFQLGNIVRGPTFECLIRHELLLSACKKP
jgi:hypothetical protein